MAGNPDFMIHSLTKLSFFGQEVYLTTTHVSIFIICVVLIVFALVVRLKMKDTIDKPSGLQNVAELIVEMLDGMVNSSMGRHAPKYRNYIGILFLFLLFSNISGLLGLRPPTADFGVTFPLGVISFVIIQFANIKWNKLGAFTDLFKPLPFLFPINLIGEIAVPFSLSLRLFYRERLLWHLFTDCSANLRFCGRVCCMGILIFFREQYRHMYFVC